MFALALIGALLATPLQSATPNWRNSSGGAATKTGASGYIDTNSITRTGDKVRFWREIRFDAVRSFKNGKQYDRITTMIEADCTATKMRSVTQRAKMGATLVFEFESTDPGDTVNPGTSGMRDFRAACFNEWRAGS